MNSVRKMTSSIPRLEQKCGNCFQLEVSFQQQRSPAFDGCGEEHSYEHKAEFRLAVTTKL